MPRKAIPLPTRLDFYTAYEPNTGCWIWLGSVTRYGYGEIRMKDYPRVVHRLRYEMKFGKIPIGMCVLHRCDNALCSNPDHMFLGTKKDNNIDRHSKGRTHRGKKTWPDKLQIKTIRSLSTDALTYWQIANYFGIKYEAVSKIIRYKTHRAVADGTNT